ncbi:WXG100 family type VII secretion target [Lentzea chajnantorensis]
MNAPATQAAGTDPQQLISTISSTYSAIERGDWVQGGLGIANTAMGIVGMASNPLSGFLSAGFSWAIQHVDFLREPFDVLLGNPEAIGKMAGSFRSAGKQVHDIAAEYKKICVEQTREWEGKAADGYRAAAQKHAGGLESLAKAADGIAGAVEGAGQLVGTVRKMIMDMISQAVSDMVMKIIQWLAASFLTFGAAIAGAISDIVTTAVKYAKKLADFLQKLSGSLQKLMKLVQSVQKIAQTAEQVINAISAMAHKGAGGGGGGVTRPSSGGLGIDAGHLDRVSGGANGQYSHDQGGYRGGPGGGSGGPQVQPVYNPGGVPVGAGGGNTGTSGTGGPVVRPPYTPPGQGSGGGQWVPGPGGGSGGSGGQWVPGPGGGSGGYPGYPQGPGGGSGGYPGYPQGPGGGSGGTGSQGPGRWVPGHWEYDQTTTAGGNTGTRPPSIGTPSTDDWYRPAVEHPASPASSTSAHSATSAAGGGGGGIPKGMGGGGGGIPAGAFGGGPGGGGGTGATAMQHGGAAGVMPTATGGVGGAVPAGGGGGGGGGAAGGMMGGAPMAGAAGQQGGSNEHKRKVRIEGDALVDPPKAAKPVIGE